MSNFADAFQAGRDAGQRFDILTIEKVPHLVTTDANGGAVVKAYEELLPTPAALKGTVKVSDLASFLAYALRFRDQDSIVFADRAAGTLTAILDYHQAPAVPLGAPPEKTPTYSPADQAVPRPRWGRHVVTLTLKHSPEWLAWTAANGKKVGQLEFAEFLENNLPDVAQPTGAELLEVVTRLEASKAARFVSSVRLANGQTQFTYEETIANNAEKGALAVPEVFVLGLSPYEGTERYRVDARFRYRIADGGKLSLWFDLVRPHKVLEDAFANVLTQARTALGSDAVILHGQR